MQRLNLTLRVELLGGNLKIYANRNNHRTTLVRVKDISFQFGLFIHCCVFHFEIDINNNDRTDTIIPKYLELIEYQNEWTVKIEKKYSTRVVP